jgi:hypothetical protein
VQDEKYRLTKEKTVIRCDDGTVYEFVQPDGHPRPRLVQSFDPDGTVRNKSGQKRVANAVNKTVNRLFGSWDK